MLTGKNRLHGGPQEGGVRYSMKSGTGSGTQHPDEKGNFKAMMKGGC